MEISGATRLYAVIGDPVAHSLSPFLMNRAFGACGLDAVYVALPVVAERFSCALEGLAAAGLAGANVTWPHKERAFRACSAVSPEAALLGAVNTLTCGSGAIRGDNTDAPGMAAALAAFDRPAAGRVALVLGAGGAARAAVLGLLAGGAQRVVCGVRSAERAAPALEGLRAQFGAERLGLAAEAREIERAVAAADLIVQATPVGLGAPPGAAGPLPLLSPDWLSARHTCFDLVYHPLETPLLTAARARGARCLDGLALLAAQARDAFQIWTGCTLELQEMHAAAHGHLARREEA